MLFQFLPHAVSSITLLTGNDIVPLYLQNHEWVVTVRDSTDLLYNISGYRPLHTVTTDHHVTWSAAIFSGLLRYTLPFRKHITYYMHGFTISMLYNMQIKLL